MKTAKLFRKILTGIALITAFNAFPAGLAFVLKPDGSLMGMSTNLFRLPLFADFLIPGLFLLIVIGGSQLLAAIWLIKQHKHALAFSLYAGLMLVVWIVIQLIILGYTSFLQPMIGVFGLSEMTLSALLKNQKNTETFK